MATLPRLEEDTKSWADRLVDELENEIEKINQAANTGTATENFAPTNFTKTKALNAGTANTAAIAIPTMIFLFMSYVS